MLRTFCCGNDRKPALVDFLKVLSQNTLYFGNRGGMSVNPAVPGFDANFRFRVATKRTAESHDSICPVFHVTATFDSHDIVVMDFLRRTGLIDETYDGRILIE